jgi:hypothetical protein
MEIKQRTITSPSVSGLVLSLDNEQVTREMDVDTNWNTLRIGVRVHLYYKYGSNLNILHTPRFYMGVSSKNGVWSESAHFVGLAYIADQLTYDSGTDTYKDESSTNEMYLNVIESGQESSSETAGQGNYFGAGLTKRTALFLEIQKNSPYDFRFFRASSGSAVDMSDSDFNTIMASNFESASLTNYSYGDSRSYNVDEITYGDLDHLCFAWNKSFMSIEFSQIAYYKID